MIQLYLITYDLNKPEQHYNALYTAIKSTGHWCHGMQNTWFVKSSHTASAIRDHLKQHIDSNDKLFVAQVGDWGSMNMKEASDWINR